MDITEITILHHIGLVLLVIWCFCALDCCHALVFFVAMIYLYMVHDRYVTRLQRKLQFEERKQANQRRVLSDSETVRWLNHAVENIWPICMEQIASQMVLRPIIPWFLEKYKPWTAKEAVVQHLYLGRSPPLFTEVRVLRQNNDDHLVLELGMNFLSADDMSAILAVKLRKRLGFGMWTKLHITGMHIEGKVLVGVKFLRTWPFIGRLRVCFVEPPYFQMTVKPIFTHGLDVTELPGIAGWLDKLLSIAFEQTLVEPNMLVVDLEKFVSPRQEPWFSMDEKDPVAYVNVEVLEGSDMKPSDLNGLADPYVKGQLGAYRFRTKINKKTLSPKWHEEFKIPIVTWESNNVLTIEVRDKDHFYDDILGDCTVNISDLRDGQRHDMWLPLENVKMGRLHLAITVIEDKEVDIKCDQNVGDSEESPESFSTAAYKSSSSVSSEKLPHEKSSKVEDDYEPIDITGQKDTGIWVHHPGSEDSRTWEPRKGCRRLDTEIQGEQNGLSVNSKSTASLTADSKSMASRPVNNDGSSSSDENPDHKNRFRRGLSKIGEVFRRNHKKEDSTGPFREDVVPSPHDNIKSVGNNSVGLRFVMDDSVSGFPIGKVQVEGGSSEGSGPDSPAKGKVRDRAKNIFRHAEKSLKQAISFKSRKNKGEKDSSDDESLSAPSSKDEGIPVVSKPITSFSIDSQKPKVIASSSNDPPKPKVIASSSNDSPKPEVIASSSNDPPKPEVIVVEKAPSKKTPVDNEAPFKKVIVE